jgi:hypothetical protein
VVTISQEAVAEEIVARWKVSELLEQVEVHLEVLGIEHRAVVDVVVADRIRTNEVGVRGLTGEVVEETVRVILKVKSKVVAMIIDRVRISRSLWLIERLRWEHALFGLHCLGLQDGFLGKPRVCYYYYEAPHRLRDTKGC